MIYEFLTGRTPFQSDSAIDTLRRVMFEEPTPPSKLRPGTPRDLETICLKCLQKEPRRRYVSAEALAEDLRRYRTGEPIGARRVGRLERAVKWVRRRPAVSALLLTLIAVVGVAVGMVTWEWRVATWEAKAEARARTEAESLRLEAADNARAAQEEKRLAEKARDHAEQSLYFQSLAAAEREYLAGSKDRALQVLDACRPDLRRWEWHYLRRVIQAQLFARPRGGAGDNADNGPASWNAFTRTAKSVPYPEILQLNPALNRDATRLAWPRNDGTLLLMDAARENGISLEAGVGPVESTAFSPDGALVAAACWEGAVKVFDAATGNLVSSCAGHNGPVNAVVFTPDGKQLDFRRAKRADQGVERRDGTGRADPGRGDQRRDGVSRQSGRRPRGRRRVRPIAQCLGPDYGKNRLATVQSQGSGAGSGLQQRRCLAGIRRRRSDDRTLFATEGRELRHGRNLVSRALVFDPPLGLQH